MRNAKQTNFQKLIFRPGPNSDIKECQLNTATFGVNCAPYLSNRIMRKLSEDFQKSHPIASKILVENMYVDGVLAGFHTIDTAIAAKTELLSVCLTGLGF